MKRQFWPNLARPSNRAFVWEALRTPGYSFFDWLHGYVYARWPYLYIGLGVGEHPLARAYQSLRRGLSRLLPRQTTAEKPASSAAKPSPKDPGQPTQGLVLAP